ATGFSTGEPQRRDRRAAERARPSQAPAARAGRLRGALSRTATGPAPERAPLPGFATVRARACRPWRPEAVARARREAPACGTRSPNSAPALRPWRALRLVPPVHATPEFGRGNPPARLPLAPPGETRRPGVGDRAVRARAPPRIRPGSP